MITISVVIPALNDAEMLERALTDVAAQTRPADEVIVVDNGSIDDTAAVAHAHHARVLTEPVRGIFAASATGYDAARGEIIARLDADSRPPAEWLARIERHFESQTPVGVVTGPGVFYGGNPVISALGRVAYIGGYFWSMRIWLGHPPIFGSNFAMRKLVWVQARERVHRTVPRIHDDLDLAMHLDPDVVVIYDKELVVGISARPFATWNGFGRRIGWAFRTLAVNYPEVSPWRRRGDRRHGPKAAPPQTAESTQLGESKHP